MQQQPQYVGRYRVIGRLGKGGMGTVWRAMDDGLNREVAIKLPNDTEPDDITRLQQECDVLMQLQHRGIVEIYGSGSMAEAPFYVVMEYVEGVTVEGLLRQRGGRLELRRALQIGLGVAEALTYAHRPPLRVIHRDIKPSNVLIRSSDGAVKVTDFGIAAVLAARSGRTVIGTPEYMPPEQFKREGVDERSDLYSLGVLLYQMLTGQLPPMFASAPAMPPGSVPGVALPPATRDRIDRLVLGLLQGDRVRRVPQSAAEVAEELRALLEGRPARPLSGPQAGSGSIYHAPTQRSSQPMVGVNPYAPTERVSQPPKVTSYAPWPKSSWENNSQPIATSHRLHRDHQLESPVDKRPKRPISWKADWAVLLGMLMALILIAASLVFLIALR